MEENRSNFRLTDIVKIFDINRHLVINLVQRGILRPLKDARGRGQARLYSYSNLVQLGVFLQLTKLNISYSRASQLLSIIKLMESGGGLEALHYISIVGFTLGGSQEVCVFGDYKKKISPEEALSEVIKFFTIPTADAIKGMEGMELNITVVAPSDIEIKPGIKKSQMSYYFIVDIQNIKKYIDLKIQQL